MDTHSFEDKQENAPAEGASKRKRKNGIIYTILILALVATWIYLLMDKQKSKRQSSELQTEVVSLDSSKAAIQKDFQAAMVQVDLLKSENDSLMKTKNSEINDLKNRINNILSERNTSQEDLEKAKQLIAQLQTRVNGYQSEINRLKEANVALTEERDQIRKDYDSTRVTLDSTTEENLNLSKTVDLASVLNASDFKITPLKVKNSGKTKEKDKAKKVDLLNVTFTIDQNRVSDSGQKELYVCITAPDGKSVVNQELGSGKFSLEDGTEKLYTTKKTIEYKTGKKQTVSIDWKQNEDFQAGTYTIEVFERGFPIGEGSVALR